MTCPALLSALGTRAFLLHCHLKALHGLDVSGSLITLHAG